MSWRFGCSTDGDFANTAEPSALAERRQRFAPHPWTWLRQVHGADVVVVSEPGGGAGTEADAAVAAIAGAVVAITTADCAPLLMWDAAAGVVAAVHAGWRGLANGVVAATTSAMAGLGAKAITATLGPTICSRHYEFGPGDLTKLALQFGPDVVATTDSGTAALDLRAAVAVAVAEAGAQLRGDPPPCTAEGPYSSWRARAEHTRQASAIWLEP